MGAASNSGSFSFGVDTQRIVNKVYTTQRVGEATVDTETSQEWMTMYIGNHMRPLQQK